MEPLKPSMLGLDRPEVHGGMIRPTLKPSRRHGLEVQRVDLQAEEQPILAL